MLGHAPGKAKYKAFNKLCIPEINISADHMFSALKVSCSC